MKKFIFCLSLVLTGLMTACIDKNEAVDADSKPSWLGGSIYQELKNPQYLTGTFLTYLRLVDDLGENETLNRTGSRTLFPANDEAFQRFFQSNNWGVTSYEQLTLSQKKMLLYNSMLDNALLLGMLSNVSNTSSTESSVSKGVAMKHQTSLNVIDTIQLLTSADQMPQNNHYWDKHRGLSNMYVVSDATRPMMVHFTREHMLNNGIKVNGDVNKDNDFAILTGTEYQDGMAYIFGDQIVKSDVTCQNGYIHQMKDVIVPPGNMAQVLREDVKTTYFSHILDFFCAPFENQDVTNSYNSWAAEQRKAGKQVNDIDMIYEVRYLNNKASHRQIQDPDGQYVDGSRLLNFDPGWNQYSQNGVSGGVDYTIADVGAMFVPTNKAMADYFTNEGEGAYLINLYGKYKGSENTESHLIENLDSLHAASPEILTLFINNLMKPSFISTVPSKFETIQNDANEYMGIATNVLEKNNDGNYDIRIANNGVIYKLSEMIAPAEYQSVMAPASVYPDMMVMRWAIKEPDTQQKLGVDFQYYLKAMQSNFAFFIPDDDAFSKCYVDPVSLGQSQPRALRFYYGTAGTRTTLCCVAYEYNEQTHQVGGVLNNGALVPFNEWKDLLIDILNYHTVVLEKGEIIGDNKYYKTKHGGEIYVTGGALNDEVKSGQQIDNGLETSRINAVYSVNNGTSYRINHVIEAPCNSVSKTLQKYDQFSDFYKFCGNFSASDLLAWAGISDVPNDFGTTEQDAYTVFTRSYKGTKTLSYRCMGGGDENVKLFNTYNYTLYAPDNNAMKAAYAAGLPKWDDVTKLYEQYANDVSDAAEKAKLKAKQMIDKMRNFVRYHFQSNSVYADKKSLSSHYNSLCTDELGLALELRVSVGDDKITVTDAKNTSHTINANNTSKKSNLMARDYIFETESTTKLTRLYTSSFCVIHELSEPLDSGNWQYKE